MPRNYHSGRNPISNEICRAFNGVSPAYTGVVLRYTITDRAHFPGDERQRKAALSSQAERLAASGIDFVQLREKDLEAAALADLGRRLLAILRAGDPPPKLLINSRADVAAGIGADGVHLTSASGSLTPAEIRRLYASTGLREPVVSVSCHTLSEVAAVRKCGASFILFGPVFEKRVGGDLVRDGSGLALLHEACIAAAPVPVLALGGITSENTAACIKAGAAGIAGIRLFQGETKRPQGESTAPPCPDRS
jgi:thiamine-phosphate pyrophosphorylase